MKYTTLIFDAFDTVVHINRARLPTCRINGSLIRTTAPALHDALGDFGIRSAFETVIVSDEVGWRKPHRIIFEQTFERMKIRPSEALFIGDQLYVDVYGALNAGMDVVWLETEEQDWLIPEIPEPTYKARSIIEVIELLEKI